MAKAHAATKELLQSIRNAAIANDKAKVERIIGFVLSAVDDRRIESAKMHRKIKEKEHQIQCKKEQLQQLWSRNARKGHKSQTRLDVEAGGRRNRKGKKSLNPNMHGGDLARVKKQKIVDLDGDGLETMFRDT
ncbi:hypothetical protein Pmar_PMAR022313 [Perkinsus marinus ATCC 50983]|uniref:Uncharacterized protein n=1 Tax=Perkinsus marinus (strain ATCC 50983 / TXsc) TaxID=423536 RepID=C5KDR5_PERM5|nr:hypothetical protein Pmar_PMAR022313 [Perkinsus marinus ATCC 50983]EER17368.1 hypothetical protein Pmar_PMAR022313 [Perkinsus marinus ATCC 50983]|eukprot:XP_002785572.1 hypothetical protein Pmar_PMAR022313 [Perkinsus marinus ATCC 50983]